MRTIIYLAPDDPSYQLYVAPFRCISCSIDQSTNRSVWQCSLSFIDDQEIDFHHVGICDGEGLSPWNQLSEEVVITAVQLILNPKVPPHNTTSNTNRI